MSSDLDDLRTGNRDTLRRLFTDYSPVLWQVARAQGLDRESAADVVQTAWLALLQRSAEIQVPQALLAWLITVTKREAWRVAAVSRRNVPVDIDDRQQPPVGAPPDDELVIAERDRVLWAAVRRLPPRCQELMRVIAFVGRPNYAEVSAALGMPRGSIGPTRGRCLARLRAMLMADSQWSGS